jgi:hypothetical protein
VDADIAPRISVQFHLHVSSSEIGSASVGRLSPLLRWLGLTMVVVLGLQLAALLTGLDWSDPSIKVQAMGAVVTLAPLGFLGLLVALIGSRLDHPRRTQTPLRWVICLISTLLALGMIAAVYLSLAKPAEDSPKLQNLTQGRQAIAEAQRFREDQDQVKALGEQLAQAGQLATDATDEDKQRAAEQMVDSQITQMQEQLEKAEQQQSRESRQRLVGVTGSAVVLAIAFVLLALTAVL